MAINTMSPNYCRSKGEQIALNVDGTTYDETNTYSAYVVCYSSSELVITHQCFKAKINPTVSSFFMLS